MRRVKSVHCGILASGVIAHEVPALIRALGLENVSTTPGTIMLETLGAAESMLDLSRVAEQARDAGAISDAEHESWTHDLRARGQAGDSFLALTGFLTSGEKP